MRRTSTICVLIGMLAALALSANAASAESISVRPVTPTFKFNPPPPKINPAVTHNAVDTFKQKGGTGGHKGGTGGNNVPGRSFDKVPGSFPQGVQVHDNGTVTIDGKTMPLTKTTEKLMREATTPPPKMWVGNQLVPINGENIQKAKELRIEEIGEKEKLQEEEIQGKLGGQYQQQPQGAGSETKIKQNAVDTFNQKDGTGGDKGGTGGDKDANANGVLIQHIETEHEGFERDTSPTNGTLQINPALVPVSR